MQVEDTVDKRVAIIYNGDIIDENEAAALADGTQSLEDFATGWDTACAKLRGLVDAEDAAYDEDHEEALQLNSAYDQGFVSGLVEGCVGGRPAMLYEWLRKFPDFDPAWPAITQQAWLIKFGTIAEVLLEEPQP